MTTTTKTHRGVLCTVDGGIRIVAIHLSDYWDSIARHIGEEDVTPLPLGKLDDPALWVGDSSDVTEPVNIGTTLWAYTMGFPRDQWLHGNVMITGGTSYGTGEQLDLTTEQLESLVGFAGAGTPA